MKKILFLMLGLSFVHGVKAQAEKKSGPKETMLYPYRKDKLWGYCDENKKIVVKPAYKEVDFFQEGIGIVKTDSGAFAIDAKGKQISSLYHYISVKNGFIHASDKNYRYSLLDMQGQMVSSKLYSQIDRFNSVGFAKVEDSYKCGVINKQGAEVVSCKYALVKLMDNQMVMLAENNNYKYKYGYYNLVSGFTIPISYKEAKEFHEGLAMVKGDEDRWGFIDSLGKIIIPFEYEICVPEEEENRDWYNETHYPNYHLDGFYDGRAVLKKGGRYGYLDRSGKTVIPFEFEKAYGFNDGYAWAKKNGKWGLINTEGKAIGAFDYTMPSLLFDKELQALDGFSEGLACVVKDTLEGFMDVNGKVVIPINFSGADAFHNGLAVYTEKGKYGVMDKQGKTVVAPQYDWIENSGTYSYDPPFSKGYAVVMKAEKYQVIDKTGKYLLSDWAQGQVSFDEYGYATTKINGKSCVINEKGKVIYTSSGDSYLIVYSANCVMDSNKDCFVNLNTGMEYRN